MSVRNKLHRSVDHFQFSLTIGGIELVLTRSETIFFTGLNLMSDPLASSVKALKEGG